MLRKLYDWVFSLARHRHATRSLAVVSFAESSFFPIPPDVMLAPMVLTRPDKAWRYAAICTLASVLGGLLGYAIGFFLEPVGLWILSLLGMAESFETAKALFQQHGAVQQQPGGGDGVQQGLGLASQNAFKAGVEAHGRRGGYLISFVIILFEIIWCRHAPARGRMLRAVGLNRAGLCSG